MDQQQLLLRLCGKYEVTFSVSWLRLSAANSSGAAQASVPKFRDTYSASIIAAAPTSATLAVRPSADSSTLLDFRSLHVQQMALVQCTALHINIATNLGTCTQHNGSLLRRRQGLSCRISFTVARPPVNDLLSILRRTQG